MYTEWWIVHWFDKLDWHFIWNSVALIIIWAVLLSTVCYSSFTTARWHLPFFFTASDCYFRPEMSTCSRALLLSLDKETVCYSVFGRRRRKNIVTSLKIIFFQERRKSTFASIVVNDDGSHLHFPQLLLLDDILYCSQKNNFLLDNS